MNPIPPSDESHLVNLINDPTRMNPRWAGDAACADLALSDSAYFPEDGGTPPIDVMTRIHAALQDAPTVAQRDLPPPTG